MKCEENRIETIDILPPKLQRLELQNNQLHNLPKLPKTLIYRDIGYNYLITKIPKIPNTLETLQCEECNLREIPNIPPMLRYIKATTNYMKSIPKMPYFHTGYKHSILVMTHNIENYYVGLYPKNTVEITYTNIFGYKYKYSFSGDYLYNLFKQYSTKKPIDGHITYHYFEYQESAKKIAKWFLECKYNPAYKYCRDSLQKDYIELYDKVK